MIKLPAILRDKNSRNLIIIILLLAAASIAIYVVFESFRIKPFKGADERPHLSSFNSGTSGTMALKELFESMNVPVKKIFEPPVDFNKGVAEKDPGVMLVIEPDGILDRNDLAHFRENADDGISVLVLTEKASAVRSWFADIDGPKHSALIDMGNALFTAVDDEEAVYRGNTLRFHGKKRFSTLPGSWEILMEDKNGIAGIESKGENGSIIVITDSQFVSNFYLGEADNGPWFFSLVDRYRNDGPVYFNEYMHGYSQSLTLLYFFVTPKYLWIIIHALLCLVLFLYAGGVRFGQFKLPRELKEKRIYYYSEGMARLLKKAARPSDLINLMADNFNKLKNLKPQLYSQSKVAEVEKYLKGESGEKKTVKGFYRHLKNG
ncbi:MAG: hypothetical protein JW969_02645 [Spirochaetales bacterium]|nr:hypothetical protein [Spirochaetales bacterium]